MSFFDFLSIVAGLVLFLYGIQTLGDGLKKVSGGKMEQILQSLTSNKWKGALLGMLVTAVIQSSGATIVMVVGFVNSEIMSLRQAVGVILGANIGTTITAWLLSLTGIQSNNIVLAMFKPANFSPIVGIIGVFMMMMAKKQRQKDIGGIMTSFAVLMIGMDAMSSGAAPLANDPKFTGILTAFSNPILGLLAGLVITVILQSSSASIGILQSISLTGVLKMGSAIPVIMGENIGSAITGIMGAIGASKNARRAALTQLVYCIMKTSVFMIGFYTLNAIFHFPIMEQTASPVAVALFHSIFNIAAVVIMLPISDLLVNIVERLVPVTDDEKAESESRKELKMLDTKFITSPVFALDQCKKATDKMAAYTQVALHTAIDLVLEYSDEGAGKVDKLEKTVDDYEDTLNSYLVTMTNMNFSPKDSHMFTLVMHVIGDFERMTDHALNIMQSAREMHEKGQEFSPKAQEELRIFHAALEDIVDRAITAFQDVDLRLASTVEPLEDVIDGLNMEVKRRHVRRLRKGKCTIELGIALEDITTDYERIADHCNNIAVYLSQMNETGFEKHDYIEHLADAAKADFLRQAEDFETKYQLPDQKAADLEAEEPEKEAKADKKKKKKDKK
jgi:phosphate:Na+ symporter